MCVCKQFIQCFPVLPVSRVVYQAHHSTQCVIRNLSHQPVFSFIQKVHGESRMMREEYSVSRNKLTLHQLMILLPIFSESLIILNKWFPRCQYDGLMQGFVLFTAACIL